MTQLIATFSSVALFACASSGPPAPSPIEIAGQTATTVAIAPINLMIALPSELETSTELVAKDIRTFVESHKKVIVQVGYRVGLELWNASTEEALRIEGPQNFESAARIFTQKLQEDFDFDVLVIPSIFLQNATWRGRVARWDGAKQRIESTGLGRYSAYCVRANWLKTVSLLIHIVDRNGEPLHTAQSGLEIFHHIESGPDPSQEDNRPTCRVVDNQPAIQDKVRLRDGIIRGLSPFLPEMPPTPDIGSQDEI